MCIGWEGSKGLLVASFNQDELSETVMQATKVTLYVPVLIYLLQI
jgi:hypothetical protein